MLRRIFLLTLAGAAALLAIELKHSAELHSSYPMQSGAQLTVSNINGSIEISGWDQSMIDIIATRYAETPELIDQVKVDVTTDASGVHIRTIAPESAHGGVKYVIKVPRGAELADIHSTNGALRISEIDGAANLHTTNGSVHASAIRGPLTATTSNGGVHADLEDTRGGAISLKTTNGGVDLKLGAVSQSSVKAVTTNGGITVHMPATASARVKAETSSHSRVRSDFEVRPEGENSPSHLEGIVGAGGPMLELTTSQGGIRLLKL